MKNDILRVKDSQRRRIVLNFLLMIADESNREKIEYIYNRYHDDMIRFARYRLRCLGISSYELDSEDVVQNAFLKIVKYIDAIDISKSEKQLKMYIFSIVANETKNFTGDNMDYDDIDIYSETMTDEDFFEKLQIDIRHDSIVEKIKQLDEKYSITFLLYYDKGMDVKKISELMGIAEKTVYTRLERGKRLLLDELPKEELS